MILLLLVVVPLASAKLFRASEAVAPLQVSEVNLVRKRQSGGSSLDTCQDSSLVVCPTLDVCCAVGDTCCAASGSAIATSSCAPPTGQCCTAGHSCASKFVCCENFCMPEGSVCCPRPKEDRPGYCPGGSSCAEEDGWCNNTSSALKNVGSVFAVLVVSLVAFI